MTTISLYGVRGSIPTPGANTIKYGGNTTCVAIKTPHDLIIIDAGTGITKLSEELQHTTHKRPTHLLFSHYHHDHTQGLPEFAPLGWEQPINIYGQQPCNQNYSLQDVITYLTSQTYCNQERVQLKAPLTYHTIKHDQKLQFQDCDIETILLNHPGGSLGYILNSDDGKAAFIWDHEQGLALFDNALMQKSANARILLHDAQYTLDEYNGRNGNISHKNWGHSSIEDVALMTLRQGIEHGYLMHHDPVHSDQIVNDLVEKAQIISLRMRGAMEGYDIELKSGEYVRRRHN